MLQKPQSKYSAVLTGLAICVFALPGCQTFKSTFTSMPTLPKLTDMKLPKPGKLAFWKKESDSVPPPPPSRHLNPSMTEGAEYASKSNADEIDIDDYRQKIDRMQDELASRKDKPMRTPYDAGSSFGGEEDSTSSGFGFQAKSEFSSKKNEFAAGIEKAEGSVSNSLSDAQKKFNDALASVKKPSRNGDLGSPADFLSTKPAAPSELKKALANSKLKSTLDAARKNTGFDESLAKVNNSLYDMNGKLTTGTANAKRAVADSVDAARERFSSALSSVNERAAEVAQSSKEFGGDLKGKLAAAASELQPLRGSDNSFKPLAKAAQSVKEKVANLGGGIDVAKAQPQQFGSLKPQNTQATESFGGGEFNRTRVATVTPVNPPAKSTRTDIASNLTKAWNNGTRQSQLKPLGIAAPTTNPDNGLRTASLNSGTFNAGSTASSIPSSFGQGGNTMANHVSDIDIPAKILSGSGSYAPGSVNQVR